MIQEEDGQEDESIRKDESENENSTHEAVSAKAITKFGKFMNQNASTLVSIAPEEEKVIEMKNP